MSNGRRRYIQEHFENNRGWVFLAPKIKLHLVETVARLADEDSPLPPRKFFDMQQNAEQLSRLEKITPEEAREQIYTNPSLLFDLNRIPYDRRLKNGPLPSTPVMDAISTAFKGFTHGPEEILQSARESLAQTGHRPNMHTGPVLFGPLANGKLTWRTVNLALALHAMPESLSDVPQRTLEEFLDANEIPIRNSRITKPPLTLQLIEKSVLATLQATGRRPVATDGDVLHGPLAGKETWNGIDIAIYHGMRGLKACGYKSLPHFMDSKNIAVDQPQRGTPRNTPLALDDIKASIRETFEKAGRRPTKNDAEVEHGPLANTERWNNIDAAFKRGNRGLKDSGYDSLKALMNGMGIPENIEEHRYNKPSFKPPIAMDDIRASIRETFIATGKRPIADGTMIAHGPLKDQLTWASLNNTIAGGRRGLKDCGYKTLKEVILSTDLAPQTETKKELLPDYGPFHLHAVFSLYGKLGPPGPLLVSYDAKPGVLDEQVQPLVFKIPYGRTMP